MTTPDIHSKNELEFQMRKQIAELERANQELRAEILEYKQEKRRIKRYDQVLEGTNRIFGSIVKAESEEQLAFSCLSVAIDVTGSQVGFVGLIGVDGLLHDISISDVGWFQCKMYDKTGNIRPPGNFILHGLYGRVIDSGKGFFTNDPQSHPDSIGLPYGHPPLTSFLGVPLILDGETIGVICVANREGGYSFEHQEDLEAIAPAVTQALQRKKEEQKRKQAEEALSEAYKNLEEKVKERTAELENAYNSLKENERSLAEAQEMAHIGNWEWDIETDKAYWSEEMFRIFKRDPQKLAPSLDEYLSYIHPDDLDYYCKVNDYTTKVRTSGLDFRIVLDNGEERTLHIKSDFIYNDENTPIRVKGIVQDITESKKAEENLRLSEERYRSFVQNFKGIIFQIDKNFNLEFIHGAVKEITGYTEEELLSNTSWRQLVEPEDMDLFIGTEEKAAQSTGDFQGELEYRIRTKDGNLKWMHEINQKISGHIGRAELYSGIIYDITEKKEAEEALKKLEIARKKEIHHRIKNNLQVIYSLLDLQAEKFKNRECVKDSEIIEAFRESQDRVMSIAFIHEELHEGRGDDALNFSLYLQRLLQNLFQTYRFGNIEICLNLDLEENIFFNMDAAVPLGMIVNELVSNSLKYAFPNRKSGEIQIKLFSEEAKDEAGNKEVAGKNPTYTLIVADNGIGIPEDVDIENPETLGLQLVNILVDQLDGKIRIKRNNGTEFRIIINL